MIAHLTITRSGRRRPGPRQDIRRSIQRGIAVAACLSAAVAVSGCGRDEGGGSTEAAQDVAEGKAEGTVDVWAMGTEGEELGAFVADFEAENPDVTVKVTPVPWEAAHDKIATAIASGDTPDVSLIGSTWMGEFAKAGGLDPTPDDLVDAESFFPGAWESTEVDGTSYGVPWYVETRVLYYRNDLAEKAGWTEAPKSWDELTQFAGDLKESGVETPLYVQPANSGTWQTALPFAWSAGAEMTNEDGTAYTLDSDGMKEGLEYYQSIFDDDFSTLNALNPGELEDGFAKGTFGSFISGPWEISLVEDAGVSRDDFTVAPLPGPDGSMGTSFIGGGNLAVFKDADDRDAAWKLVEWLSQPDVQSAWYETMSDLPAVQASWDDGALAADDKLAVFGEQLTSGNAPPTTPTWEEVAAVIDRNIEAVVRGEMDVEEAVADMQSQAESIGTGL